MFNGQLSFDERELTRRGALLIAIFYRELTVAVAAASLSLVFLELFPDRRSGERKFHRAILNFASSRTSSLFSLFFFFPLVQYASS